MSATQAPRCLIVEDQTLIGMSLEAYLEDMGWSIAGQFGNSAGALKWLETNTADAAIIDFMLQDGPCLELARALHRRGVPFLVYSGRKREPDTPSEFHDVPWLEKPLARADLVQALMRLRNGGSAPQGRTETRPDGSQGPS
jgi:DNA-binding response OmpR family regulator